MSSTQFPLEPTPADALLAEHGAHAIDHADVAIPEAVEAALDDDLNTAQALADLAAIAGNARVLRGAIAQGEATGTGPLQALAALAASLRAGGAVLGLLQQDPAAWFARGASNDDDARIQGLIDERLAAKASRDFARADAIRDQLAAEGILLEDTPQGVRWKRA